MMVRDEARASAERPLQGVLLCFTSVGPEERTRYADLASQMGAEHKLDLTSDTTHLIVGDTNTLKYQYVAKEREDIKVLRPEWIEGVRELWMKAMPLDLDALARQYRVPTLAGLKICITGFDDLSFRAQLQRNVIDNGGEYTGDLTKDVTHLIAAKPEGKKYEYGMQWQRKIVSLRWYKDTLERGMQLDEKLYHPTMPTSEQGIGAWNRQSRRAPQLGKRTREEEVGPEPSRKLRRTASARLGSQNQDMWSDIVGGAGFEAKPADRPQLKPSVSMPALRKADSFASITKHQQSESFDGTTTADALQPNPGFLAGRRFIVEGFDEKKEDLLRRILLGNGGTIAGEEVDQDAFNTNNTLMILPHDIGRNRSTPSRLFRQGIQTVSELWLERCMQQKSLVPPEDYPLGKVINGPATPFTGVSVNATGFEGIEARHISKIIQVLGGEYAEVFTSAVSVLICKPGEIGKVKQQKFDLAQRSSIPIVSEEWLWSTIRTMKKAKVENYLTRPYQGRMLDEQIARHKQAPSKEYVEVSTLPLPPDISEKRARQQSKPDRSLSEPQNDATAVKQPQESLAMVYQDLHEHSLDSEHASDRPNQSNTQAESCVHDDMPLQEVSSNSTGRNSRSSGQRKSSIQGLDGPASMENPKQEENAQDTTQKFSDEPKSNNVQAINGAIREILDQHSKKKSANNKPRDDPGKKKGRLIGRALSNLSNSSATSTMRRSRASSIDSMNTDGMGSEIVPLQSGNQSAEAASATVAEKASSKFSFTGRAKTTLGAGAGMGMKPRPFEMHDLDLSMGDFPGREEAAPPMTQLGYEDPEEAIALREKLAESRRKRSKNNNDGDGKNEDVPTNTKQVTRVKSDRKIRDDDMLAGANAGWGAGRRTRHKQRSPHQGIQEF